VVKQAVEGSQGGGARAAACRKEAVAAGQWWWRGAAPSRQPHVPGARGKVVQGRVVVGVLVFYAQVR